ncbi:hypothetical protein NPIL_281001 [Nephila pilipes]|uniref:Uncharacterized protein n=1 Tax=Nephila pilipes TaxID=299642 RepID=A0A8X6J8S5_NEPPI|nr:hypothetical protein NPIL_281001 [Nephila pilipes]
MKCNGTHPRRILVPNLRLHDDYSRYALVSDSQGKSTHCKNVFPLSTWSLSQSKLSFSHPRTTTGTDTLRGVFVTPDGHPRRLQRSRRPS